MAMTKLGNALRVALSNLSSKVKIAQDSELEKMLTVARKDNFDIPKALTLVIAMDAEAEKPAKAVMDALVDVDEPKAKKEEEGANDCAECKAKDGKHAKDCKMGKDKKAKDAAEEDDAKKAMDAAIKLETDKVRADMREAEEAKRAVRPVVGDVIAQDSAAEIYGFALDQLKIDRAGVEGVPALRALFNAASKPAATVAPVIAQDAKGAETMFPGLARFGRA